MSTLSFRSLAPRSLLAAARVAAPLALALCAACASAEQSSRVRELMNAGEYERAAIEAAAWRERAPRSAEAEHAHQMASAALLLERGRRATFTRATSSKLRSRPTNACWCTHRRTSARGTAARASCSR
jgi:hypothetical protein